ncbi:MAG TPA: hypothetical protein VNV66_21065 [Pilimelia sp.]|nr:hypothetical protein [Pilimelia sp.]
MRVAPPGAKAAEVIAVGALVVVVAPVVVQGLMVIIDSRLSRQPDDVEVEIDGNRLRVRVTKAQRDGLVETLLRRANPS